MNKNNNFFDILDNSDIKSPEKSPLNIAITKLMSLFGLNDRELAKETNLAATIIVRLRNDPTANPTISTILPIANFFGVTIDQLIHNSINDEEIEKKFRIKKIRLYHQKNILTKIDSKNHSYEMIDYYGNKNPDSLFCILIANSDYEPFIKRKSKVVFCNDFKIKENLIVLAKYNEQLHICKTVQLDGEILLKSLKLTNSKPIKLSGIEQILGSVTEIIL
jgi:transcriptional regulator with XRE-family HTH domain